MNTDIAVVTEINKWLADRGRTLDGRPILRIVQAGLQREMRRGLFTDYYNKVIILREVFEVREVPKYGYIHPGVWVLEKLVFLDPRSTTAKELPQSQNGSYECLTAFQDPSGGPCEVSWKMVNMVIWCLENPGRKLSESDMRDEFNQLMEEDALYFYNILADEGRSPLFAFEESAFMDSSKQGMWKKNEIVIGA